MNMHFNSSEHGSIGTELEWQLIDLNNFNLASSAYPLLTNINNVRLAYKFKPEITTGMIEFNSTIHHSIDSLYKEMLEAKSSILKETNKLGIGICGGGAHPFQHWENQEITPTEPFLTDLARYGYLAKLFTVFGQHIHIGCDNGDEAIYLCHALSAYIPHFIALSASSPFYQQQDSKFDSSRITLINSFPFCGHLPYVKNWQEYSNYIENILDLKMIKTEKDLFWDMRPKQLFGTVEIRVCDSPLTTERAVDLVAYAQMLCVYLREQRIDMPDDLYFPYYFNRYESAKRGLEGNYIDPITKQPHTLKEHILATCQALKPYANKLGSTHSLNRIIQVCETEKNDAYLIRKEYASTGMKSLLRKSIALWKG